MNTEQLEKVAYRIKPDLTLLDSDDRIILLVQARGSLQKPGYTTEVISWVKDGHGIIPFVMLVDLKNIQIFKWDSPNLSEPVCFLNTADVLSKYGLEITDEFITKDHLSIKVDFWLSDLVYHTRYHTAPAEEQIRAIGLLPLLKDRIVQTEMEIRIDPNLRYIVLRYYYPRSDFY